MGSKLKREERLKIWLWKPEVVPGGQSRGKAQPRTVQQVRRGQRLEPQEKGEREREQEGPEGTSQSHGTLMITGGSISKSEK